MEATTTARRRTHLPMSYYMEMVKDMDDTPRLDFPDMDKELYTPEEAYELTMKDIKAIYGKEYAV